MRLAPCVCPQQNAYYCLSLHRLLLQLYGRRCTSACSTFASPAIRCCLVGLQRPPFRSRSLFACWVRLHMHFWHNSSREKPGEGGTSHVGGWCGIRYSTNQSAQKKEGPSEYPGPIRRRKQLAAMAIVGVSVVLVPLEYFSVASTFRIDILSSLVHKLKELLVGFELTAPRIPMKSIVERTAHSDPEDIKTILDRHV